MELCLYNAVLTAMSHNGKSFTYHNQLASSEDDLDKRCDWFTVACCPPNIMRLFGSIGGYVWSCDEEALQKDGVAVHLYVSGTLTLPGKYSKTSISQTTQWPWDDKIDFAITGEDRFSIDLRIPSWATGFSLEPACSEAKLHDGYLRIESDWLAKNKKFSLRVPMKPRWIAPPTMTGQDIVALMRGPVVYCVEDFDNEWVQDHFKASILIISVNVWYSDRISLR